MEKAVCWSKKAWSKSWFHSLVPRMISSATNWMSDGVGGCGGMKPWREGIHGSFQMLTKFPELIRWQWPNFKKGTK